MKKLITLFAVILLSATVVHSQSVTYLVHNGTGATWTITEIEGTEIFPIDLSKINNGSAASLDAWFNDRSLESPTMGEDAFQFAAGDKVWIIKGTYVLTDSIILFPGVSVYGGFAGSENAISGRAKGDNPWDFTNETVLDGNEATMCIFGSSASAPTIVDGLTISKGKSASTVSGAGATLNGSQIVMQNCIIKNCVSEATATTSSGGIVLTGAATIKDSYIHDNQTAKYGAGITVCGDACTISGCKITKNTAAEFGGGVNLFSTTSGVSVLNCEISENITTTKSGGGLLVYSTAVDNADPITISGCTFTSNEATVGNGGALYLNTKAANIVNVTNCTFTGNAAKNTSNSTGNGGGAIWVGQGIHNIDKCTFTNNSATIANGGAIIIASSSATATISNSIFTGNSSGKHGSTLMFTASGTMNNCLVYKNKGGNSVYVGSTANVLGTFNNCTFASNTNAAGTGPSVIYLSTPTAPNAEFKNCLFYNSGTKPSIAVDPNGGVLAPPSVEYCGFDQEGLSDSTWLNKPTNIFTITKTSFFNADEDDYHLAAGSPAIDKGTHIDGCDPDLDGFARTAPFDMGAYEYNPDYPPSSSVDKVEYPFDCYAYGNSIIVKGLEQEEVNIYSITGVRVFSKQVTGSMSIDLPAGIYIVNIANFNKKVIVR